MFDYTFSGVDLEDRGHKAMLNFFAVAQQLSGRTPVIYVKNNVFKRKKMEKEMRGLLKFKRGTRKNLLMPFHLMVNHAKFTFTKAEEVGAFECIYNEYYGPNANPTDANEHA